MHILFCPNCDSRVERGPYTILPELGMRLWLDTCPQEGCGWENLGMDLI